MPEKLRLFTIIVISACTPAIYTTVDYPEVHIQSMSKLGDIDVMNVVVPNPYTWKLDGTLKCHLEGNELVGTYEEKFSIPPRSDRRFRVPVMISGSYVCYLP